MSAVRVIKTESSVCLSVCLCLCVSVCLSVCLFVGTLTAEPIGVRSQNCVHELTLMTSRTGLMVKAIQLKNVILKFLPVFSVLYDIIAYKGLRCVHAQNFRHASAHFAHAHARNHKICPRAQIGSARRRCSNTL